MELHPWLSCERRLFFSRAILSSRHNAHETMELVIHGRACYLRRPLGISRLRGRSKRRFDTGAMGADKYKLAFMIFGRYRPTLMLKRCLLVMLGVIACSCSSKTVASDCDTAKRILSSEIEKLSQKCNVDDDCILYGVQFESCGMDLAIAKSAQAGAERLVLVKQNAWQTCKYIPPPCARVPQKAVCKKEICVSTEGM
jgi:hypothetical protein